MAHDHHVDFHRFDIAHGVSERLALFHRAAGGAEIDAVRGQAFLRSSKEMRVRVESS
jgi:hypothetical protein